MTSFVRRVTATQQVLPPHRREEREVTAKKAAITGILTTIVITITTVEKAARVETKRIDVATMTDVTTATTEGMHL